MVVVTNTLHQPLTVMVKLTDTVFTHVTVFGVVWYHNLEDTRGTEHTIHSDYNITQWQIQTLKGFGGRLFHTEKHGMSLTMQLNISLANTLKPH